MNAAHFGAALASLDLNGDGLLELAVGSHEASAASGSVEILFLRASWSADTASSRCAHSSAGETGPSLSAALWLLLRATPPAPKRAIFPPLRLLLGAPDDTETPHHAPWWLIIFRLLIAALIILGLSRPIWTPPAVENEERPALIVVDNGWAAANSWPETARRAELLINDAERDNRLVALLFTAPGESAPAPIRLASKVVHCAGPRSPATKGGMLTTVGAVRYRANRPLSPMSCGAKDVRASVPQHAERRRRSAAVDGLAEQRGHDLLRERRRGARTRPRTRTRTCTRAACREA